MAEKKSETVSTTIKVPEDIVLPDPLGANFFHFTVVGPEIQMLVGSVNLLALHQAKVRGGGGVTVPAITHRFALSALGFQSLKAQIEAVAPSVSASGVGIKAGVE